MERLTYTVREVVEITGLSRTTISGHIRTGRLPSVKIGGRRMIHKKDLQLFLTDPDKSFVVDPTGENTDFWKGFTND